jgi:hypothetical protein
LGQFRRVDADKSQRLTGHLDRIPIHDPRRPGHRHGQRRKRRKAEHQKESGPKT